MNIKNIRNKLIKTSASVLMAISIMLAPASVSALSMPNSNGIASVSSNTACSALNSLDSNQGCGKGNGQSSVDSLISTVINIISLIVGIAAVIMIIISGMRFITSGGDAQKVSGAKSSLIYALIGLVIVAVAQAIIRFTIYNASGAVK